MIQEKSTIIQVLGSIIKQPDYLSETGDYRIETTDFPEKFHRIIFAAINNLYQNGAETIDSIVIDGFLSQYDIQYEIFNQNNGLEYLERIQTMAEVENFPYYYERLKKFSLIREMDGLGFDISDIYDESEMNPRVAEEQQEKFDEMSITDILKIYDEKLVEVKDKFESDTGARGVQAGEGIDELLDRLEKSPEIGLPLNSPMLSSVARGARMSKFYLRSSYSGGGKTRSMIADALRLSALGWYDSEEEEWVQNDFQESCVLISTEMLTEELQTPALAYIADVEEHKILQGLMTEEENERVRYAANILKNSSLYFEELPNFNVKDIERTIEKQVIKNQVSYVWFDYLSTSVEIFNEMSQNSGIRLREDQILLMMSDKLKAMANKYNVFLMSATQLSGDWKEAWRKGDEIDSTFIQGSKAIVNKADLLAIMLPVSQKEKKEVKEILASGWYPKKPNRVTHISKNRGNPYNSIKIFSYLNMGTMRIVDLFATNYEGELIPIDIITVKNKDLVEDDSEEDIGETDAEETLEEELEFSF